jgi:hypothetical protein
VGSLKKEVTIAIIILIIFLFIATLDPFEPTDLVNEKTISNYSNLFFDYKIIRYPTSAEIVPVTEENINLGIVTDPWNIKFGIIPGNGSYVKRYINIKNMNENFSKITLKTYGNITPLVNFSKNDFDLSGNESVAVEANLYTESAEFGNYSGEIDVIIKTPKYDLLKIIT